MKILGWSVIRWKNMQRVHDMSRQRMARIEDLERENKSLRGTVAHYEDKTEALEKKCDLVNVSAMKNRIVELEEKLNAKEMPGHELPFVDPRQLDLLSEPLVRPTHHAETGYFEFKATDDGRVQVVDVSAISSGTDFK